MKKSWNERAERDAFFFVETEHWNGDVEEFFRLGEERTRLLVDPVLDERRVDPGNAFALEIGCGLGRFSRALAHRFDHVLAVDVSDGMIRRALELNPPEEHPNLIFEVTDGISLPAQDEAVDFAFSYEVFQHLPSRGVMRSNIAEVHRVLRRGGTALLHFRWSESRLLSTDVGRAVYESLRAAKHFVFNDDRLLTDSSFRGIGGLSASAITGECEAAGLHVETWFVDPTGPSNVFVVAERS
jgi:ubiquinone/menaquinone biosynthesis C-methylase UbiE